MPKPKRLLVSDLTEKALLEDWLRRVPTTSPILRVGPGDDCAVLGGSKPDRWRALKTDAVVRGVHYLPETLGQDVGWKAICRVLSDLAAMGAKPEAALVTVAAPADTDAEFLKAVYEGIGKAARKYDVVVAGGETTRTFSDLVISVAMTGHLKSKAIALRSGARAGDKIYVTGRLGGSGGGRHLNFKPRLKEGRWLASEGGVRAMMDLSDGLGADLPRMAEASGLDFLVDESCIPRHKGASVAQAISEGEDYELLLAIPANREAMILRDWRKKFKLPLTRIGEWVRTGKGRPLTAEGFDHFAGKGGAKK